MKRAFLILFAAFTTIMHTSFLLSLSLLFLSFCTSAQPLSQDSAYKIVKATPAFSIYKDNYLISGVPFNKGIDNTTSDIKYQISLQQRLTSTILPFNTYLSLVYTQLAFWNIYASSSPFADLNFNPGISLSRLVFRNNKLAGIGSLLLEHQSNGKSGEDSRSWNDVSLIYSLSVKNKFRVTAKGWIPFSYKDGNPDLISYIGYGEIKANWVILPEKLMADVLIKKGTSWDWRGSLQCQVYFKPFKSENQYLMIQWYQGYAENLLNYNVSSSMIRIGMLIKAFNFGFY